LRDPGQLRRGGSWRAPIGTEARAYPSGQSSNPPRQQPDTASDSATYTGVIESDESVRTLTVHRHVAGADRSRPTALIVRPVTGGDLAAAAGQRNGCSADDKRHHRSDQVVGMHAAGSGLHHRLPLHSRLAAGHRVRPADPLLRTT
jgi:hypothetical protein